jgi:hypothetical protein
MVWIVLGLLVAVWVKTGTWPLGGWLRAAPELASSARAWLFMIVMPTLGLYLLYRVVPLFAPFASLRWLMVGSGSLVVLLALVQIAGAPRPDALPTALSTVLGGLGIVAAALGGRRWLGALIYVIAPLQLGVASMTGKRADQGVDVPVVPRLAGSRALFRFAGGVSRVLEAEVFGRGPLWLWQALMTVAEVVHRTIEQGGMKPAVEGAWRALISASGYVQRAVERGGVDSTIDLVAVICRDGSRWLQRRHTGRLRINLRWAVLGFIAAALLVGMTDW